VRKPYFAAVAIFLAAATGPAAAQKYAAVIQPSLPLPAFCAGHTVTVTVGLGNNGVGATALWTTNNDFLRYQWKQGAVVVYGAQKTSLPTNVPAGGHTSVSATVQAPAAPGTWDLVFDMAADDAGWFSWFGSKTWSQTVTVQSAIACASQSMPLPFVPKISKCSYFTKPGFFLICEGTNFGDTPGKILMKGIPGNPDLELWAGPGSWGTRSWTDTGIFVNVPKDLSGFRSSQVKLQVVNGLNRASNEVTTRLDPLLDYVLLTEGITVTQCEKAGDACKIGSRWYQNGTLQPTSLYGGKYHGGSGHDGYTYAVGADFVLDRWEFCGNDDLQWNNPKVTKFADGQTSGALGVDWSTNFWGDELQYFVFIYAYGPRGVSPK
jgi:hypothetical protein